MAKAIEQLPSGLIIGHAALGLHGEKPGTVRQQVHDGDTINVRALGNFGVRFLGVDAPEISFQLPGEKNFTALSNPAWETFLQDPFASSFPPFTPSLKPRLQDYLQGRMGKGIGVNHYAHAQAAQKALEKEILQDIRILDQTEENFQFFLAFSHEVMDRYGRFLCFINRYQPQSTPSIPRPVDYNTRLLSLGQVTPYFIWPNINPFRKKESLVQAVIPPGQAKDLAEKDEATCKARQAIANARQQKIGIFNADDPLKLLPFEVRFLARRSPPNRWVIDISKNDVFLIHPQDYYTIENIEDRLFIPEEYVPLFVTAGWKQ
jgi:endonuclease YncB( thermonuclease family)